MSIKDKVNILLVDDQPAKLLSYEAMLGSLEENLIKASSPKEALEQLLKSDIAVVLMDVCMPDLDGFELAALIRQHPRYQKTAIILVSAIHLTDFDRLRGYDSGAVDYVPVPVIPEVLRAKVTVFVELYRKTQQLERLNRELERRVEERTAALEASTARLSESEERFRLATEAMRGGVYDWDVCSNTVQRSPGLTAILGYELQETDSSRDWWIARTHPDDVEETRQAIQAALEGDAPAYGREYRVRHRDDRWLWIWDRGRIVRDATGRAVRVVGHTTDVNAQKQAEEALREADRRKDEFLATISHELRTPLTAMLGWTRMLRTGGLDENTTQRALETIERNAKAQAQLIEDLIDVSRIISGKIRLNVRPVAPTRLVEAAIDVAHPALQAKGIQIDRQLNWNNDMILADPDRLQQVVWNLLSNAIKFTPSGGRVQVRLEQAGSQLEISVSDSGQGIHPEFVPYVFERFRQADSAITRKHGGLGLGLAIVRHLVELHGGTVGVQSPGEGEGATFTVRLPMMTTFPSRTSSTPAESLLARSERPFRYPANSTGPES